MKFYKIWRTYSWVYSGDNCSCTSNNACVISLPETLYFNDVLQRLIVEWIKLDHSIVVATISQWRRRLSACVKAHGGQFKHIWW